MRQRRPLLAALAALAAIVFTQVAIAAASWESAPSPCHEQAPAANFCFEHCSNNDLTLDTPRLELPAVAVAATRFSLVTPVPYPQVAAARIAVLPPGPPPRILYHSFLI
jgi:hypothetical protein